MCRESGGGPRLADFPRTKEAQQGPFFWVESGVARTHDAQMRCTEILDRSALEILVDHRRTDVGAARNSRRIPELVADATHHARYHPFCFAFAVRRTVLGKCNRGDYVPPHVRKSFAVNSSPRCSRTESLSREPVRLQAPPCQM